MSVNTAPLHLLSFEFKFLHLYDTLKIRVFQEKRYLCADFP